MNRLEPLLLDSDFNIKFFSKLSLVEYYGNPSLLIDAYQCRSHRCLPEFFSVNEVRCRRDEIRLGGKRQKGRGAQTTLPFRPLLKRGKRGNYKERLRTMGHVSGICSSLKTVSGAWVVSPYWSGVRFQEERESFFALFVFH
ncbi:hypothetical protein NPIL_34511 [Nephila pilipes]|uniref:Uncharacterized protein n=1 Tax=Nephila pilipes TaxID=299642 RepID=A0A8X6N9R0_NEPPI|nr:hypothetical protein NPIL_34511 [Nephila pilipes]